MPFSPEQAPHYRTLKWRMASSYVRWCAHDTCQDCGTPSGAERPGKVPVRLTVAHLNRTPGDDRHENLRLLCDACHCRYDHAANQRTAKRTRQRRKDAARPLLKVMHA
jgi:hypothetical protein